MQGVHYQEAMVMKSLKLKTFSRCKWRTSTRTRQYLRPLHRSIVPSMEIRVKFRLILAGYNGCTNAWCILSRSYEYEEFKNANHFAM